jgi:hypothetical protein
MKIKKLCDYELAASGGDGKNPGALPCFVCSPSGH